MFTYSKTPQTIPSVLMDAWRLYRSCFVSMLILGFITAALGSAQMIVQIMGVTTVQGGNHVISITHLCIVIALLLLDIWLVGTIYTFLGKKALEEKINLPLAFAHALRRYFPLLVVTVISVILIFLGFFLFVFPGIILLIFLMYALPLLMIDKKSMFSALGNSFRLAAGNWWYSFFTLLVPFIVFVVLIAPTEIVLAHMQLGQTSISRGGIIYNLIIMTLIMPWIYATVVVLFHNVKLRKAVNTPKEK
jgi:hypothetical protein